MKTYIWKKGSIHCEGSFSIWEIGGFDILHFPGVSIYLWTKFGYESRGELQLSNIPSMYSHL